MPSQSAEIRAILQRHVIDARVAPAATAGYVSVAESTPATLAAAGQLPGGGPATTTTVFDLASVSKPIVACTLLRLARRGVLTLETPLGAALEAARGTPSEAVPLELLLAHRGGLDAHRSLFAPVFAGAPFVRRAALAIAAGARRPDCAGTPPEAGFPPLYSDLGYLLIGAAIEARTGRALDAVIDDEVAKPLGVALGSARALRRARADFDAVVAPTEVVRARGGWLRGIVHDENAWALGGHGASGHAGLFGTVTDVVSFGAALLEALAGRSAWLDATELTRLVAPRPGGTLRAGFDSKSAGASSAGTLAGPLTFGHLGFTGTSLWCDPAAGVATVLLTNRVCPTRENAAIRTVRPVIHDALFRSAKRLLPVAPNP